MSASVSGARRKRLSRVRGHARPLLRREEEADVVEPLDEVLEEAVDLDPGRALSRRHAVVGRRRAAGGAAPLVGEEQHRLREVERAVGRVHRHRDHGVGAHHVGGLEPGALGAEEDADLLAGGDHRAGLAHRLLGGHHQLGHRPVAGGGGEDVGEVGAGLGGGGGDGGAVEDPAGTARHRLGARVRPAVARCYEAHPVEAEVPHRPSRGADVLAHLRRHQHEGRLRPGLDGPGVIGARHARPSLLTPAVIRCRPDRTRRRRWPAIRAVADDAPRRARRAGRRRRAADVRCALLHGCAGTCSAARSPTAASSGSARRGEAAALALPGVRPMTMAGDAPDAGDRARAGGGGRRPRAAGRLLALADRFVGGLPAK